MAKPIGTLGTIETLTVGNRVFTDLTNLITLGGKATGSNRTTLRKMGPNSGAGYAVTALKTLSIYALNVFATGASAVSAAIGQSDNDVGLDQATALTNPKYFMTGSSTLIDMVQGVAGAGVQSFISGNPLGTAAASKFVSIDANGVALFLIAHGYEA